MGNKAKFYVVYDGSTFDLISLHRSWEECRVSSKKRKGLAYKSFPSKAELDLFVSKLNHLNSPAKEEKTSLEGAIYTDGSFNPRCPFAAWAWVYVENEVIIYQESGLCPEKNHSRNVDGELMAVMKAGHWCSTEKKRVKLYYDYEGVRSWALGLWKRNNSLTKEYHEKVQTYVKHFIFLKVKAHSNHRWNDYVDELAKSEIVDHLKKLKNIS